MEALIYLDTHVVAWLYAGEIDRFGAPVRKLIEQEPLRFSPAVVLELQYLREIGRVADRPATITRTLSAQIGLKECDQPFAAIIESALEQDWTRDPFDRIIVGQAALSGSQLVTKDREIRRHYRRAVW